MKGFSLKERVPFREIMGFILKDYQNLLNPLFYDPILDAKAQYDLFKNFSYRILTLITPTLLNELDNYDQKIYGYKLHTILFKEFNPLHNPLYKPFLGILLNGGWEKTLKKTPLLKELLDLNVGYWVQYITEIFDRVKSDLDLITPFTGMVPSDKKRYIKRLELDKGDLHNQQRSAAVLTFIHGKVVYKPNSAKINLAFCALSDWLRSYNSPYVPKKVDCLDRGSYGWYKFIKKTSSKKLETVRKYHNNLGALTALTTVMGSTDFHSENFLKTGVDPVVIDAECLLSGNFLDQRSHGIFERCALRTGFFSYHMRCSKSYKEEAGIGLEFSTDKKNRISAKSFSRLSKGNKQAFLNGFLDMFSFLCSVKKPLLEALTSDEGALRPFSEALIRIVYKGTAMYGQIVADSLFHLENSRKMDNALKNLPHPYWVVPKMTRSMRSQEIKEMKTQNIPHFLIRADEVLYTPKFQKKKIKIFKKSPMDNFIQNVKNLSQASLKKQFFLVKSAVSGELGRPVLKSLFPKSKSRNFLRYFDCLTF